MYAYDQIGFGDLSQWVQMTSHGGAEDSQALA